MKKNIVIIAAMLTAGFAFAADGNKEKGGDKPKHHGPPPMEKLDTNKDGKVSMDEFKAGAPAEATPEKIAEKFKKLDADGDGSITKEEFGAMRKKHEGHGDKPKDGDKPK